MKHLKSTLDASQNFLLKAGSYGHLEARYVRRTAEYVAAYVSSAYDCNMGCKFCHLTHMDKMHQNNKMASLQDYAHQLETVMHYVEQVEKKPDVGISNRVNINFMARGDALANATILNNYKALYDTFRALVPGDKRIRMNLSTIFPKTMQHRTLIQVLNDVPDTFLYYSLYNTNEKFRNYWIPNSIPYQKALEQLKSYQETNGRLITFHWAFIKGHNDNVEDMKNVAKTIDSFKFSSTKFNLVRFNSPDNQYTEPEMQKLQEMFNIINSVMSNDEPSKIVTRVGKDISASCGMFIP